MNRDLYELYALGLLEEPERSQVEAELQSGSPEARERLRAALENNAILTAGVELKDPPARLRENVLRAVGGQAGSNRRWLWAWGLAAASLAVVSVTLAAQWVRTAQELEQTSAELRQVSLRAAGTNAELARARNILSILDSPETRFVTFGPTDPKPPRGQVVVHPLRGVLLIASNLPPAPAGSIYEMWVIPPRGASPVPAGLFQSASGGNAMHFHQAQLAPGSAVAVTLEPETGSEKPTTTPLFVAVI
ncbi:MAG: anti-sigma factor [Bryobacteraceae bacterium]|nr:anti-sigma factor [Bryobacteraceae bacterium]